MRRYWSTIAQGRYDDWRSMLSERVIKQLEGTLGPSGMRDLFLTERPRLIGVLSIPEQVSVSPFAENGAWISPEVSSEVQWVLDVHTTVEGGRVLLDDPNVVDVELPAASLVIREYQVNGNLLREPYEIGPDFALGALKRGVAECLVVVASFCPRDNSKCVLGFTDETGWIHRCTACRSRFAEDGSWLNGPATVSLTRFRLTRTEVGLEVHSHTGRRMGDPGWHSNVWCPGPK